LSLEQILQKNNNSRSEPNIPIHFFDVDLLASYSPLIKIAQKKGTGETSLCPIN